MTIVIIIAVLMVIILTMGVTIAVLCVKRSRYKAMEMSITMANLNETSIDNPVYEGMRLLYVYGKSSFPSIMYIQTYLPKFWHR